MTEQEHDRLFAAVDEVRKRLGIEHCIWSFGERHVPGYVGDYRQMLLDNVPFRNERVRFTYSMGWDDADTLVDDRVVENPTMEDVFAAADRLLARSNDSHHVFVEGAVPQGVDHQGVITYDLYFGS